MTRLSLLSGILMILLFIRTAETRIIEKVVAYVGDEAITLTEVCHYWRSLKEIQPEVGLQEALEGLLNRKIILYRARQINLTAETEDELIELYIRFTIRPKVTVTKQQVRQYYFENYQKLKGLPIEKVQDQITRILYEKKTNKLLKDHLKQLKKDLSVGINGPLTEDLCSP